MRGVTAISVNTRPSQWSIPALSIPTGCDVCGSPARSLAPECRQVHKLRHRLLPAPGSPWEQRDRLYSEYSLSGLLKPARPKCQGLFMKLLGISREWESILTPSPREERAFMLEHFTRGVPGPVVPDIGCQEEGPTFQPSKREK